jgi:dTDP-4-dehydrorhamnose reductase
MKILIVGATGMLGYSLFCNLSDYSQYEVYGTVRSILSKETFFNNYMENIVMNVDVTNEASLVDVLSKIRPEVVINCVGLIKQHDVSKQHIAAIEINSLLPHKLAHLCDSYSAKLIHFSTDCVFNGESGLYKESDVPNASDLYGKSKCLGEVSYGSHLTLRTSIIGHELNLAVSLVDWFLSQKGAINGYSNAIFSGLPTCYIAQLLAEKILPKHDLNGLYHLSVEPIDKLTLLEIIAKAYGKDIEINKYEKLVIDRSLDSSILREKIGLKIPSWVQLIECMHADYLKRYQ